mmetsp:Transcript_10194/g.15452  ORF Transcript_10194/g.15452 Transcript_10194/m.15452 type:complete len:450 (+) Transcript_10194:28-1377(+)
MESKLWSCFLLLAVCTLETSAEEIPDETYGYITVRPGAHMFYWFYGSTNPSLPRNDLPIVLWLQGGPGAGSSGFGNFGEFGPLNTSLLPRQDTWLHKVNLLFIDNPVGAGYSYVDELSLLTTNVSAIAADLLVMHRSLSALYPFISRLPFWIFSESYGGKMTAHFAVLLYNAIADGEIAINLQGVVLGDSWISGISYVNTWPDYLYALSLLDNAQYHALQATADACEQAVMNGAWNNATEIWADMEVQIANYTNNVDFYNALQFDLNGDDSVKQQQKPLDVLRYYHLQYMDAYLSAGAGINETQIAVLMNTVVRDQLGGVVPSQVVWGGQSDDVFEAQSGDFMKPVVDDVNTLLKYGVKVNVWNGQLDLICCTLGTLEWLQTIDWEYVETWHNQAKVGVTNPSGTDIAYFKKTYLNLSMYYMMKSGHMVPADNPVAALMGLCDVTGVPF